jgi:hypothetical protein
MIPLRLDPVRGVLLVAAIVFGSRSVLANTFTETFTGGSNAGGWLYGGPAETIETTGGNPGAFYHSPTLDTFAPQPRTSGPDSVFTGDFRTRNITAIGIDLITISVDFSAAGRPLTLMLISDAGTPGDPNDDWAAYFMGPVNVPVPGQGWASFSFAVPSQATSLPAGWQTIALGPNSPPPDWNDVITDVDQVRFFYGDPTNFFIFQMWSVGIDNVTIVGDVVPVELIGFEVE